MLVKYVPPGGLFGIDFTKFNFDRGSALEPAGGTYDTPPDP